MPPVSAWRRSSRRWRGVPKSRETRKLPHELTVGRYTFAALLLVRLHSPGGFLVERDPLETFLARVFRVLAAFSRGGVHKGARAVNLQSYAKHSRHKSLMLSDILLQVPEENISAKS